MEKKDAIEKIKELLGFSKTIEFKFFDVKDVDGNILRVASEALAIGESLTIVTEAGEEPAKPETKYVLEDGSTIVTDADGKIAEILEKEVEVAVDAPVGPVGPVDPVNPVAPVGPVGPVEAVETVDNSNLESRISTLEEMVKELISSQSKQVEATMSMIQIVEDFGKTPVETKIVNDFKSTFSTEKEKIKDVKERNLEEIRNMRK